MVGKGVMHAYTCSCTLPMHVCTCACTQEHTHQSRISLRENLATTRTNAPLTHVTRWGNFIGTVSKWRQTWNIPSDIFYEKQAFSALKFLVTSVSDAVCCGIASCIPSLTGCHTPPICCSQQYLQILPNAWERLKKSDKTESPDAEDSGGRTMKWHQEGDPGGVLGYW